MNSPHAESRTPQRLRPEEAKATFEIDTNVFSEDVVFKALYWYGGDFDVNVARGRDGFLLVTLTPKQGDLKETQRSALQSRLLQDLLDFKTRAIVEQETRTVRELLIAKAFAASDEFDSTPPGSPEDPVGFQIEDWEG